MTTQPTHVIREAVPMMPTAPILPAVIEQTARSIFESFSEKLKNTLNGRDQRALKLALEGHVTHKSGRIFSVRSEDGQHSYLVDLEKSYCTCPDSQKGHVCKHRLAAYLIEQSMLTKCNAPEAIQESAPAPIAQDTPAPAPAQPPLDPQEETIEKVRLALYARSEFVRESIIYAKLPLDGELLPVEIIDLQDDTAFVRALRIHVVGMLMPRFPFPERKSFARVLAKSLTEVRIYR